MDELTMWRERAERAEKRLGAIRIIANKALNAAEATKADYSSDAILASIFENALETISEDA